jgi:hypothetical protein
MKVKDFNKTTVPIMIYSCKRKGITYRFYACPEPSNIDDPPMFHLYLNDGEARLDIRRDYNYWHDPQVQRFIFNNMIRMLIVWKRKNAYNKPR